MGETTNRRRSSQFHAVMIALSVEETQIVGALVSETGQILSLQSKPAKQTTVRATVASISKLILELAALSERDRYEIKAIGISVPGIIDHQAERVSFFNHQSFNWERVPLRSLIEEELGNSGIDIRLPAKAAPNRSASMTSAHPVIAVYSTRDSLVAAEAWCGAAAGKSNIVTLSLDPPMTIGLMMDGKILHGIGDVAGAASWLAFSENYKDEYATQGAFAAEAGETSLIRKTLEKWTPKSESALSQIVISSPSEIDAATIIRAARSNDPLALSVVLELCSWVGKAAANLISLLNPEAVVLTGKFGRRLKPFLSEIRQEAKIWASPPAFKQCKISVSTFKENAELLGAAKLALNQVNR